MSAWTCLDWLLLCLGIVVGWQIPTLARVKRTSGGERKKWAGKLRP